MNLFSSTLRFAPGAAVQAALVLTLSALTSVRAAEGWGTNFAEAKAAAAKDNKDILMDFTGSDWCGWCIRLQKEVFTKDAFKQEAPKHFVLLELDFPQQKELPAELKAQNDKLQEEFGIEGFPTIILADAKGRPYARTGYMQGGPEAYNEHLAELRGTRETRDAAFKKAEGAQGLDKAKALQEGLNALDPEVVAAHYQAEVDQIISLDTDDSLGYKAKKAYQEKRGELDNQLEELAQNQKTKEFAAAIDAFIEKEKVKGVNLQDLLLTKLQVMGPGDIDKAEAVVDEVIRIDAKSELGERATEIKGRIAEMRAQIEKSKKDPADAEKKEGDGDKPAEKTAEEGEKKE